MRRSIKGVALACVGALVASLVLLLGSFTSSAGAATYPPSTCATLSVSTTTPQPGETISVTGEQFQPNSTIKLYLTPKSDYPSTAGTSGQPASSSVLLKIVTADAHGKFSADVTMPPAARGHQILSASGPGKICPADPIQITVSGGAPGGGSTSSSGSNPGTTAMTGVDIALLSGIALVLLVAGALFARSGRRSRHAGVRH